MPFHFPYAVKRGDNLTKIGKPWGFSNPGPIFKYPPNQSTFKGRTADQLRPGDRLMVPYPPESLKKIVATSRHLAADVARSAKKLIAEQHANQKQLEQFLFKVDAVNFLASLGVSIGALSVQGAKGAQMSSKEALLWLAESRASIASNIATFCIRAPQAPRRDFRFWVRHSLGPWNPSYWASVVTAIKEKDLDVYLYGAGATTHKAVTKITRQANSDIKKMEARASEARRQLAMPFYRHRV